MNAIIKRTLILAALGLASAGMCCGRAYAADIELPGRKLIIKDKVPDNPLKRKISWYARDEGIVIGAPGSPDDPRCVEDGGSGAGGTIQFFSDGSGGSNQDTGILNLPCENWRRIGTAASPRGYRYTDKRLDNSPCRYVRVKKGRYVKASCRGYNPSNPLNYDLTVGTDEGVIGTILTVGTTRYCTAFDDYRGRDGRDGRAFYGRSSPAPASCPVPSAPCDCCTSGFTTLAFEGGAPTGVCGELRNFSCSNDVNTACSGDTDCDLGPCFVSWGLCTGNFDLPCSSDADCQGMCDEQGDGPLRHLICGHTYMGGGGNALPPSQTPGGWESLAKVTACSSETGELTIGPKTASETGSRVNCTEGRKCSNTNASCAGDEDCSGGVCEDRCFFGPVSPNPRTDIPALSMCNVLVVQEDVMGAAQCDSGGGDLSMTGLVRVYLTGDLLSATRPPNVPGIQPCPLCVRLCESGANAGFPCDGDADCGGGTCGGSTKCLGGASNGGGCTPGTPDLGDALPTSQDCPPLTSQLMVELATTFPLGSTSTTVDAVDHANADRVFCGYCRDVSGIGSQCFAGDPGSSCPLQGDGVPVPCTLDADCTPPYESCAQRNGGAFGSGAATRISLFGSTDGQCLDDGLAHDVKWVGFSCIPPTFDLLLDGIGDLPGPNAIGIRGKVKLSP